jgi:hypothetical protein
MVDTYPTPIYSYDELRNNALGKTRSIPRTEAIALLLASNFPNKEEDFELLLENQNEPSTIRYLAAISLGKLNTTRAKEILDKNTLVGDDQVLTGITKALGYIGDEHSIDFLISVKERTVGFVASQAEFAAALISYRLNLKGNDLPFPSQQDYLGIPSEFQHMQISVAADQEIKEYFDSLINEPVGIRLGEKPAYQVFYDRGVGMVLFNEDVISQGHTRILLKRKAFLGIFADKDGESGRYSVAYLILTSPREESRRINILIYRPNGKLIFAGIAEVEAENTKFSIRSVAQVGVFPLLIEGSIKDSKLNITTAQFSTAIPNKNEPSQSDIACDHSGKINHTIN